MKKLCYSIMFVLCAAGAGAQPVLEHTYDSTWRVDMINLSAAGYKYVVVGNATLKVDINNLDHSLYRSIPLPNNQVNSSFYWIAYASDHLFNNDDLIEVAVPYYGDNVSIPDKILIINENGQAVDSMVGFYSKLVTDSFGNFKLITRTLDDKYFVYKLPGTVPCVAGCGYTVNLNYRGGASPVLSDPKTNPGKDEVEIGYRLPPMQRRAVIVLQSAGRSVLKKFIVTDEEMLLRIKTDELPPGSYNYRLMTPTYVSKTHVLNLLK